MTLRPIESVYHYYWFVIVLRCKQMKIKWKLFWVGSGHCPFNWFNEKGRRARLVNHSAYNILIYISSPLRIFISISHYYRICVVRQRVIPTWNANWHSSSRGNSTLDRLLLFKNAYCVYIITPLFPLACNYTARRYSRLLHKGCTKYIILYCPQRDSFYNKPLDFFFLK